MVLSLILLAFSSVSVANNYERKVYAHTLDKWKTAFELENLLTVNAGGVWGDKSVFTNTSQFPSSVTMDDSQKNFIVSFSAISANKEIAGYSYIPTYRYDNCS